MDRGLPPAETARPHCRLGLGLQMGGVAPEAQPPGVPGEGREEGKARPLTLLPACPTSAISSILGTWLDQYSEDFCQPPDFPCLRQLVAYVQLNMPGSDLERRAHLLLAQLEHADLGEAEPEGEEGRVGAGLGGRRHSSCWARRRD